MTLIGIPGIVIEFVENCVINLFNNQTILANNIFNSFYEKKSFVNISSRRRAI